MHALAQHGSSVHCLIGGTSLGIAAAPLYDSRRMVGSKQINLTEGRDDPGKFELCAHTSLALKCETGYLIQPVPKSNLVSSFLFL